MEKDEITETGKESMKNNKTLLIVVAAVLTVLLVFGMLKLVDVITGSSIVTNSEGKLKLRELEKIELEDYKSSVFSMKKPKGWQVSTGGDGIYYAIRVTDPTDSRNQIFLMIKMQPLLKSNESKSFWESYYRLSGNNPQYRVFSDAVVLDNPTTEGFYKKFNDIAGYVKSVDSSFSSINFPTFNNFIKIDEAEATASMKSVALDSKVLRATFTNENAKEAEGMFLASVVNFGNDSKGGVDTLYYMVYDIMTITSVKDRFIDYKDILLESINSIEFTDSYVKQTIDDGNAQTKNALALSASIQSAFDSYMSAWENRNKTYDIMSQKQSDAILGYERVYNTETGEIYKAYNGFFDDYSGNKYQPVGDEMYTNKITGYIDKVD